ncbi:hypothetical protein HPB48_018885 [Haemaphysalis longicornis]|uniref:Vitamin K-dependent protein C n=1 Tax=Haemaphysalis longicornis TaxID=44386 RepID=A0A9J6G3M4_HAELO|nr:hypothetical protein HPB48_018885 [Haemaphysalis longicornis]
MQQLPLRPVQRERERQPRGERTACSGRRLALDGTVVWSPVRVEYGVPLKGATATFEGGEVHASAAIYRKNEGRAEVGCGGALVSDKHVLTAAHCVSVGVRARLSTDDHTEPVDAEVVDVVRHQRYDPRTYANDITLLVLREPVRWNRFVQPACLPFGPLANESLKDYNAFIVGWGATKFNGAGSSVLRQAQIPVWDETKCSSAYAQHLPISNSQLCAGDVNATMDSCQGDSGGPLLLPHQRRYYVIGIVSSGKDCATPGFPGIYTRVSSYLDWLRNAMGIK